MKSNSGGAGEGKDGYAEERNPYVMLREARKWIATWAGACVGAQEMVDRIAECERRRPESALELAARFGGYKPHRERP